MSVKFSNNGHSTLAASLSSSATSITVASGHGARFPSLSSGEYFYATLIDASNNLEIVKVTARSSDVLTATRAQEGTTARAYAIGDRIELRVTAQGLVDLTSVNLDGDKGDITVSSDGATWSIDNNVVGADELNVSGNGTAGQALLSDGDGTFSFGTAGGVRQVKQVTANGEFGTASTSYVNTGLVNLSFDNAIASGSKVLVQLETFLGEHYHGSWAGHAGITVFDGSTNIGNSGDSSFRSIHASTAGNDSGATQYLVMMVYGSVLHTPASTTPAYTIRLKSHNSSMTRYLGSPANGSTSYDTGGTRLTIWEITV
jgi:ribosomal protein L18